MFLIYYFLIIIVALRRNQENIPIRDRNYFYRFRSSFNPVTENQRNPQNESRVSHTGWTSFNGTTFSFNMTMNYNNIHTNALGRPS